MSKQHQKYKFNPKTGMFELEKIKLQPNSKFTYPMVVYRPYIFDMVVFVFTCKQHKMILLQKMDKEVLFLPNYPFNICNSWRYSIVTTFKYLREEISIKKKQCSDFNIVKVIQFKTSKFGDFIYQLFVDIELKECNKACSSTYKQLVWTEIDKVVISNKELLGPEPTIVSDQCKYCTYEDFCYQSEIKSQEKKWKLISLVDFQERDIVNLFDDFMQHCFPSKYMNQVLFKNFLKRSKVDISVNSKVYSTERLYNAFCINNSYHVSFRDFIMAFCALDKKCVHGNLGGELRTRCILRYYAKAGSKEISYDEILLMNEDIASVAKNKSENIGNATDVTQKLFKELELSNDKKISFEKFIELVGSLKIRGTASIFRSANSPVQELRMKKLYSFLLMREVKDGEKKFPKVLKKKCITCNVHKYSAAIHSFNIDCNLNTNTFQKELPEDIIKNMKSKVTKKSIDIHNPDQIYNELRQILRRFCNQKYGFPRIDSNQACIKWENKEERINLTDKILKVCADSMEIFKKSPRVTKLESPVYVFGDIHGNFKDMMTYDYLFWKRAPNGFVANSLFLGDYVDRGENSIECVLYLLCLKLLVPNKIHMLRGNHESRPLQQQFTFQKECLEKFANKGNAIWEAFNNTFDCMPLCGVIDEQIYCAHGGIPTNATRLENLYNIPIPLPNPSAQSKVAWEVLWNDPVSTGEYNEFTNLFKNPDSFPDYPKGFLPNIKRGTGYYYSQEAVETFLNQNSLSFIIRAHEVIPPGYQFHMNGKLVSIFSCSNYCGAVNESAVAYIEDCKIRIIKLETNKK